MAIRPELTEMRPPLVVRTGRTEGAGVERRRRGKTAVGAPAGQRRRGLGCRHRIHIDPAGRAVIKDAQRRADGVEKAVGHAERRCELADIDDRPPEKLRPITKSP